MKNIIIYVVFLFSVTYINGQGIGPILLKIVEPIVVPTTSKQECEMCCTTNTYFRLNNISITPNGKCPSNERKFSIAVNAKTAKCVKINDSILNSKKIKKQYLVGSINAGFQWLDFKSPPKEYVDVTYGIYINMFSADKIIIPLAVRTGLGLVNNNDIALSGKAEITTGIYLKNLNTLLSVNLGYAQIENLKSKSIPYVSFGTNILIKNGRNSSRNIEKDPL